MNFFDLPNKLRRGHSRALNDPTPLIKISTSTAFLERGRQSVLRITVSIYPPTLTDLEQDSGVRVAPALTVLRRMRPALCNVKVKLRPHLGVKILHDPFKGTIGSSDSLPVVPWGSPLSEEVVIEVSEGILEVWPFVDAIPLIEVTAQVDPTYEEITHVMSETLALPVRQSQNPVCDALAQLHAYCRS